MGDTASEYDFGDNLWCDFCEFHRNCTSKAPSNSYAILYFLYCAKINQILSPILKITACFVIGRLSKASLIDSYDMVFIVFENIDGVCPPHPVAEIAVYEEQGGSFVD